MCRPTHARLLTADRIEWSTNLLERSADTKAAVGTEGGDVPRDDWRGPLLEPELPGGSMLASPLTADRRRVAMVDPVGGEPRELDQGRQVRFVVTPTGVRVAYAVVGRGPALVVPAAWVGHLEIGWQDPAMRAFYAPIAAFRTVVAYDKPGCGLSDPWPVPQTLDSDLEVLRAVIDHLKLGRVDLLGLSMGAPLSLA
jgi:hypothetical protein